jgi:hypothetical protein
MKNKYILLFERFLELELDPEVEPIPKVYSMGVAVIPGWNVY